MKTGLSKFRFIGLIALTHIAGIALPLIGADPGINRDRVCEMAKCFLGFHGGLESRQSIAEVAQQRFKRGDTLADVWRAIGEADGRRNRDTDRMVLIVRRRRIEVCFVRRFEDQTIEAITVGIQVDANERVDRVLSWIGPNLPLPQLYRDEQHPDIED
jgi:hypothetical protein